MVDRFASFNKTIDGPYDRAVALLPAMGEFDPTLAVVVNLQGTLVCFLAENGTPVSLAFNANNTGKILKLRLKRVVSFELGAGGPNQFASNIDAVIGLY